MAKIGFIGLGIMGKPMAGHLIKGGHTLFLQTRSGVPKELLEQGGKACVSPKEVAQNADIIITMLPDTPDVEKVLFGENGVACGLVSGEAARLREARRAPPSGNDGIKDNMRGGAAGLAAGKMVVDMSSISPIATKEIALRINQLGCDYLDAPVSGGDVGAKNATLSIMVGGPASAFEKMLPIFSLMGKTITLIGGNGSGQICKVANQIVTAITIEAVAEALLFAAKAGADPGKVRQALMGGFASSRVMEIHGERMIKRNFTPGFRVELHQKDLNIALSSARALGVSLPGTATVQELFSTCIANGNAKSDNSSIVQVLEKLANHEIA